MKILLTKVYHAEFDTNSERLRIKKEFRHDHEIRRRLTLLMDAVEKLQWKKARRMLNNNWWKGRDEKMECRRTEFIGLLEWSGHSKNGVVHADGFALRTSLADLVDVMSRTSESDDVQYTAECVNE